MMEVFDSTPCTLGEGPLWHPERGQLFWFDIIGKTLFCREGQTLHQWRFDENVSAAGWVDRDTLLIASETGLFRFDIETGRQCLVQTLEADNAATRSNDGRADPWGGFWIGTMGKNAEPKAGAIYRYYRGELRRIVSHISISNAICFAPDQSCAYYTDTVDKIIRRQPLVPEDGWPLGEPEAFIDLRAEGFNPDGAVCDADSYVWVAQWGAARVARYAPDGRLVEVIEAPTDHVSCPAFGGQDLTTLFATTARQGLSEQQLADQPAGQTLSIETAFKGLPEPPVILE